jgi:hypothetical protein
VVVKARADPHVEARAVWGDEVLALLAGRGYPVPRSLWHGMLDESWSLVVQSRLPGEPIRTLDGRTLDGLLRLIDLQADVGLGTGGWDVSWWLEVVLFQGWEHWWERAEEAAPTTSRRLRAFLAPASDHRLPYTDAVHGDFNLTNVLTQTGAITGVVDWDHVGMGSRAVDLAGLLFDVHRLGLNTETTLPPDGDARIVRRIVDAAGERGLRCAVSYGAIARLALAAQRGERDSVETCARITHAILDSLGAR